MRETSPELRRLLDALRRHLPLTAYPKGRLIESLRRGSRDRGSSGRCRVTHVFDAGDELGLLCQLEVDDNSASGPLIVTPIADLAFRRGHPIQREIANYHRCRGSRRAARVEQRGE
jgi:hypothetical protein